MNKIRHLPNYQYSRGFPRPRPMPTSLIPGQDVDLPAPFSDYGVPPDIRQYADVRESLARGTVPFREQEFRRFETVPGGIRLVNLTQPIKAVNVPQLAVAQNFHRKRFLVGTLDTVAPTVYLAFGGSANGYFPLQPGAVWDENGSEVCTDEIWIKAGVAGVSVSIYEGVPDDMLRHRQR
jgi:hypothetical protein